MGYYLPSWRWVRSLSGEILDGGRWVREQHGYLSLPLMVRPNSIIAAGAHDVRPDYDYARDVTFHLFELTDGADATAHVPTLDGRITVTCSVQRHGSQVYVEVSGESAAWRLLPRGSVGVNSVQRGTVHTDAQRLRIVPDKGGDRLVIALKEG